MSSVSAPSTDATPCAPKAVVKPAMYSGARLRPEGSCSVTARTVTSVTEVGGADRVVLVTSGVEWLLAVVQVPAQPTRHRVAVWRELRRAGAVPVSQGTWALPAADSFRRALGRAAELASEGGGSVAVFAIQAQDEVSRALVEDAFLAARLDEWREFVADCGKFTDEIAREFAK